MIYALQRAAQDLLDEIDKYGITVRPTAGIIVWKDHAIKLNPFAPKMVCKREIRRLIKMAKADAEAKQMKNQARLFEDKELGKSDTAKSQG